MKQNKYREQNADFKDHSLSGELERLTHELFRKLYLKNRSANQTQGKVLKILYRKGQLSQKEVQEILDVKSGSISEIITKLEKRELVTRVQDSSDKRRVLLTLTDKGRLDVEEFSRKYQDSVMQCFEVLDEQEKREYRRILRKLLNQEGAKEDAEGESAT